MIKVLKSKNLDELYNATHNTHKVGSLNYTDYYDLVRTFGQPSIPKTSSDGKVQKEWVLEFKGEIYTIYDWKTFDEQETVQELQNWSIGGKTLPEEFVEELKFLLPDLSEIS